MPIPDLYRVAHLQMINLVQYLSLGAKGTYIIQEAIIDQETCVLSPWKEKFMLALFELLHAVHYDQDNLFSRDHQLSNRAKFYHLLMVIDFDIAIFITKTIF